jgi:hypothetical protein
MNACSLLSVLGISLVGVICKGSLSEARLSYLSAITKTSAIKATTSCPNANAVFLSFVPFVHHTVHSETTDTARKPQTRPEGMNLLMRSYCHPSDICRPGISWISSYASSGLGKITELGITVSTLPARRERERERERDGDDHLVCITQLFCTHPDSNAPTVFAWPNRTHSRSRYRPATLRRCNSARFAFAYMQSYGGPCMLASHESVCQPLSQEPSHFTSSATYWMSLSAFS